VPDRASLVYYMHDGSDGFRFRLAGELSEQTAGDLEQARRTAASIIGQRSLSVDLTGLTGLDVAGRKLLKEWSALGAQLTVVSLGARARIQMMTALPVTLVGSSPRASTWFPSRAAGLCLAALLALVLLATLGALRPLADQLHWCLSSAMEGCAKHHQIS